MSDNKTTAASDQVRINIAQQSELDTWSKKLDATPDQLREAVAAVGDLASEVELHLKGSRSSINSERVHNALQGDPK